MNTITVNGVTVSPEQVYAEMQLHPADSLETAQKQATEALIVRELMLQRAAERGLQAEDQDALISRLLEQEVTVAEPTQSECERFYQSHPQQFSSSPLVEARHILLAAAPDDLKQRQQVRGQAEALIQRLTENASEFARLAEKFSACPSAKTGGSLGQITRGQTVAEFEQVLFRAQPGLLPTPVESRYGFHVVEVERHVAGECLPFDLVSERIRDYLKARAERLTLADYLRRLADAAEIEGYDMLPDPLIQ